MSDARNDHSHGRCCADMSDVDFSTYSCGQLTKEQLSGLSDSCNDYSRVRRCANMSDGDLHRIHADSCRKISNLVCLMVVVAIVIADAVPTCLTLTFNVFMRTAVSVSLAK